jgi:hypothetical protein
LYSFKGSPDGESPIGALTGFDSAGNLWIADYGHGRVLEYIFSAGSASSSTTTTTSSASGGVPEFPYQTAVAAVFASILAGSYLLVRRRSGLG